MSYKITKIPSQLKGPYTASDLPSVTVSNMGFVDFSKSYVEFEATVNAVATSATAKQGVYAVNVQAPHNEQYTNSVLINKLSHKINNKLVQDSTDFNIFTQNMAQYTRNLTTMMSNNMDNVTELSNSNYTNDPVESSKKWRNLVQLGTNQSTDSVVSLRVPCKDVMSFGRSIVNTNGMEHEIKCSVDTSKLSLVNYRPYSDPTVAANYLACDDFNSPAGGAILNAGSVANPIVVTDTYALNKWKVFVGQAVVMTYTYGGNTLTKQLLITQINYDTVSRQISLVFDEIVQVVAVNSTMTLINLISEPAALTLNVNQMNIVLKMLPPLDPNVVALKGTRTYKVPEWKLEKFNIDASLNFNKTFNLEPNTVNAILMTPLNGELVSIKDTLTEYNMLLDGMPLTDRNVTYLTCDYYNEVQKVFKNLGKMNMKYNYEVHNFQTTFGTTAQSKMLVSTVVNPKDRSQVLQINLVAVGAPTAKVGYLWKQVLKTVTM